MSSAPTPAPHCPINFLKGGGNATFSANCIKLLAELNYEPSDFGTYKDVKKKCDAARNVARRSAIAYRGASTKAEKAFAANPTPENRDRMIEAQKKETAARAQVDAANKARGKAAHARNQAAAASNRAEEAKCLADQGDRIANGQGRTTGRHPGIPANAPPVNSSLAMQPFPR